MSLHQLTHHESVPSDSRQVMSASVVVAGVRRRRIERIAVGVDELAAGRIVRANVEVLAGPEGTLVTLHCVETLAQFVALTPLMHVVLTSSTAKQDSQVLERPNRNQRISSFLLGLSRTWLSCLAVELVST